jgi:hypothetical protein
MSDVDRGQIVADAARVYEEFFVPALFGQWGPRLVRAADVAPATGSSTSGVAPASRRGRPRP